MKVVKREFYFRHQGERCYLQITGWCRKHAGEMKLGVKGRQPKPFDATWDHLAPRSKTFGNQRRIQLLACAACNHQKGDAEIATDAQFVYARALERVWSRVASGQDEAKAFQSECAPWIERNGNCIFAMQLPVDLSMPIDVKTENRRLVRSRPPRGHFGAPYLYHPPEMADDSADARRQRNLSMQEAVQRYIDRHKVRR